MHLKGHGLLALVAIVLCSSACGIPSLIGTALTPAHIEQMPQGYRSGFVANGTYRLRHAVFVVKRPSGMGGIPDYLIVAPGDAATGGDIPKSIEEYDRLGAHHWPEVVDALPAGLLLQFKELKFVASRTGGDWIGFDQPYDNDVGHPLFVVQDSKAGQLGAIDGVAIATEVRDEEHETITVVGKLDYLESVAPPATSQ